MILYFIGTIYTLASTAFVILLLGKLFCVKSLTFIYDKCELSLGYATLVLTILFGIGIFFKNEQLLVLTVFAMLMGLFVLSLGLLVILYFKLHQRITKWHLNLKHKKNM